MHIAGSCHCQNISFALTWTPEPTSIQVRDCTCSFCIKHGGVWTSCPTGSLKVIVNDPARVTRYTFGTKTATFHVCSRCGVVPVVTSTIDGHIYAVVNVNAFDGVPSSLLQRETVTFDDESEGARLARRKRNWIADVEYVAEGDPHTRP